MKSNHFIALAGILVLLFSCAKNSVEEIKQSNINNNTCDTVSMTYVKDVAPMIQKYSCLACHVTGSGLVTIDNYQDVKNNAGRILASIKHDPSLATTKWMPSGGSKVTDCEISKFESWINQGFAQ